MTTLPQAKLDALLDRFTMVEAELQRQLPPEQFVKLSREFAELEPVAQKVKAYRGVETELKDIEALVDDPDMREMAAAEKPMLEAKRDALTEQLRIALLPKDAMDERNVILEIRAGTGGDEAALFAGDLLRKLGAKPIATPYEKRPADWPCNEIPPAIVPESCS